MKYKSAREVMIAMNNGEIPRKHLGPKNFLILKQELFSIKNEYNPNTSTAREIEDWDNTMFDRLEEIDQLPTAEKEQLFKEVDIMLGFTN